MNNDRLLNRATPGLNRVKLGDVMSDMIAEHNALVTKYNALLAKLDADAGITDTDYVATVAATSVTLLNDR